jgi:hypothetical protein
MLQPDVYAQIFGLHDSTAPTLLLTQLSKGVHQFEGGSYDRT